MRQGGATRKTGFTLAELLVGLVVTSIVLAAVVAGFLGVQLSYQAETEVKIITENGRGVMLFMERVLPLAGYGLDPRVAFDVTGTVARDNQAIQGITYSPAQPAIPGAAGQVVSDELAFRFRDPAFLRVGRLNTGHTQVTIDTALGLSLPVGKLLMVGCQGGTDFAMVRVTAAALPAATVVSVANAAAPFINNASNCLQGTGSASPWLFVVQEHRLRIVNLGGRPWLVSFRNLEASVTDLSLDNFDPIAPDVESFQIAFGMNRARPSLGCCQTAPDPPPGNANHVVGDALLETFFAQPGSPLTSLPDYRSGYDRPERFQRHPANIRSVHVGLVLRSSRSLPNGGRAQTGDIFNYDAPTVMTDGFKRSLFHTAVNTPNLLSRSGFMPSLRTTVVGSDLNSWGG